MVSFGTLYAVVVVALLLFALGLGLRVLKQIAIEGVERQRERTGGDGRPDADEGVSQGPAVTVSGDRQVVCPHCDTRNSQEFAYCRRCAEPL